MPADLQWYTTADVAAPGTIDFGTVRPGVTSSVIQRRLKNVGTTGAVAIKAKIVQASVLDGALSATANAVALTASDQTIITSIAAGAFVLFDLTWSTPAGATPVSSDTASIAATFEDA